jgi:hypothetical protein
MPAITQIHVILRSEQAVITTLAPICETALHCSTGHGLAHAVAAQWQHNGWNKIRHPILLT